MTSTHERNAEDFVRKALTKSFPNKSIERIEDYTDSYSSNLQLVIEGRKYVLEIKFLSTVRIQELIGTLATGILRTRRIADSTGAMPLVIAVAPRFGTKTVKQVEEFMLLNANETAWGLLDKTGRIRLCLPDRGWDVNERPLLNSGTKKPEKSRRVQLFSDLNRWLLKILLMRETPKTMWSGPRERVESPTHLGQLGNVSISKAHRFYHTFRDRNYVRRSAEGLCVVRKRLLMDAWMAEEVNHERVEMPARFLYGEPPIILEKLNLGGTLRFAVSGFEACRLHGILHTSSPYLSIHVEDEFSECLEWWELEECSLRDAHLVLTRPSYPESVFRGIVKIEGLPVVDVLQAALDVRPTKPSGLEQTEFTIDHVLKWGDIS